MTGAISNPSRYIDIYSSGGARLINKNLRITPESGEDYGFPMTEAAVTGQAPPATTTSGLGSTSLIGKQAFPRILLVGTHLPPNAGSRSVGEGLAERLQALGFAVRLTSKQRSKALRIADMLATVWSARHWYDVVQLDVYSGAAFFWAEWVSRAVQMLGKPLVLTLHGGNLPKFARNHPQRISRLFARAKAVTAPSRYLADALREFQRDIEVIPNPLDLEAYQYRQRDNLKAKLTWLRTFHRIYNPVLAVQVLARIASRFPEARLMMIGPDKDGSLAEVQAEAKRLGFLGQITFTGGVAKSQVPPLLSTGDIFLNTTTIDNTPVSVLEAMASGLNVVSTNVGGIPYLIENEHDGLLVPSGDADAMTAAVMRLLTDAGLATRLSRNARKKSESYSWDAILPLWKTLLTDAARTRSSRNA
jgi:glycosyltransferase involved in cell wall biosynthesis